MSAKTTAGTIDPAQIQNASGIPPQGANFVGLSPEGLVEVSSGTLSGDIDAQPAAKELLGTALDTGGLSNADYIYTQVSALYGGKQLPDFQSKSGNKVKSLVFASGSAQGGYGAFHFPGTQADFDRIVVDSLDVSGSYSAGSGLGSALAPLKTKAPRLFPMFRGGHDLLGVIHVGDPRLKGVKREALRDALVFAGQSISALKTAVETRNFSAIPQLTPAYISHASAKGEVSELTRMLIQANLAIIALADAALAASAGRKYLSTALFAAEIIESFEMLTGKADAGQTDGEAVSRVVAFKLAPEIALVPGFNSGVTQQWWKDGHPDWVTDNSQNDQSTDGNAAGVMFLLFLTDYLGVAMDQILKSMPAKSGAALGQTYVSLLKAQPALAKVAGVDGSTAFQKMISLLQANTQSPDGTLNLPADGNPFPSMAGAAQGGLFASGPTPVSSNGAVAQDAQAALLLETQIEQQVAALKAALQQIRGDASGTPPPALARAKARAGLVKKAAKDAAFAYKPPLVGSAAATLAQRAAPFRAPQYDQALQGQFWGHVYNELPNTGTNIDRLQVITGTEAAPLAVQITGTIKKIASEKDGDDHIYFQPDDPNFPTNQDSAEPPLEIEIIYAGPVSQPDAKPAEKGYTNPFDASQLGAGTRILAAGPLIYDRAHGRVDASGNVLYGLEIHPLVGMTVLSANGGPPPPPPPPPPTTDTGQLSSDLDSALGQAGTLSQTLGNLTALIQKMKGEAPGS